MWRDEELGWLSTRYLYSIEAPVESRYCVTVLLMHQGSYKYEHSAKYKARNEADLYILQPSEYLASLGPLIH
jgi:hypothetical protein